LRTSDLIILGFILAVFLTYNITKGLRQRRAGKKMLLARKAVQNTASELSEQGYRIVEVEQNYPVLVNVDDRQYRHVVKIDLVVAKQGKTYLVEVKSGKQTRRLNSARSRRQLLEYYSVRRADGIILFDADNGKIRHISFQMAVNRTEQRLRDVTLIAVGILVTYLYFYFRVR